MKSDEGDPLPMKLLLRKVYTNHMTKVKCLSNEVGELKRKLLESERRVQELETNCQKCAELEEAFKTCQTALLEQSKKFENLGQRFSVFNTSINSRDESFISRDDPKENNNKVSHPSADLNSSLSKHNLLKNLMSQTETLQDTLDLCTEGGAYNMNHDYSSFDQDSLILAPDTIDIVCEVKTKTFVEPDFVKNVESELEPSAKKPVKLVGSAFANLKDSQEIGRLTRKRSNPDKSPPNTIYKKKNSGSSTTSDSVPKEQFLPKALATSKSLGDDGKCSEINSKKPNNESNVKDSAVNVECGKGTDIESVNLRNKDRLENNTNISSKCKTNNIGAVSIVETNVIPNDDINEIAKNISEAKIKNSLHLVLPSIQTNKNSEKINVIPPHIVVEDIDDFQTSTTRKKSDETESAWAKCDKKKLQKVTQNLKPLKSISRFKLSLEALPRNFKKPVYKQTKLSKSIFQRKQPKESEEDSNSENQNPSTVCSQDEIQILQEDTKASTFDFDATFIPDNFVFELTPESKECQQKAKNPKSCDDKEPLCVSDIDEDSWGHPNPNSPLLDRQNKDSPSTSHGRGKKKATVSLSFEEQAPLTNSFDRLPKKQDPNYKYKEEPVRKKAERRQLNGHECKECEKYFSELGLTDKEKQDRLKKCSRHRSKFTPPTTPEHFWELEFPDTPECKARGYMNETQRGSLKSLRRRPL